MAPRRTTYQVAEDLLSKENLPVAISVAEKLMNAAMEAKDSKKARRYGALLDSLEGLQAEESEPESKPASASLPGAPPPSAAVDRAKK